MFKEKFLRELHNDGDGDGVQEDLVHLMLNVKGVVFPIQDREEVVLVLRKDGAGPVTAADILNLATTDPAKSLDNADSHEYFAENTSSLQ